MRQSTRGSEVTPMPSNRAPFYSDATVAGDTGLLASNATKTVNVVDFAGNQAIGQNITIVNESSQDATVYIYTCINDDPEMTSSLEKPINPYVIPSGEAASGIFVRGVKFLETNVGSGSQTGRGLRYYVELERKQH